MQLLSKLPFGRLATSQPVITSAITIENGLIKLLVYRGREVLDYRSLLANPQFFRESLVNNRPRVANIIKNALAEMSLPSLTAVGAVPGFQAALRLIALPVHTKVEAGIVIPREATRAMGISLENTHLTWQQLPNKLGQTRWLVVAAARRAMASYTETMEAAGLNVTDLDLRPFALARAVNQPEAVIAWVAPDGCDIVIVKECVPVEYQSLFWGADPVEGAILTTRLTDVIERTITRYDQVNPEGPLPEDSPVYVTGSVIGHEPDIAQHVAEALQKPMGMLAPPLSYPNDFPIHDFIVNVGLALREG